MTHTVIRSWPAAWMHLPLGGRAKVIPVTNSATGERCLLVPPTPNNYSRPLSYFIYGIAQTSLMDYVRQMEGRGLFAVELCEATSHDRVRAHLNVRPAQEDSAVKLTVHRNPEGLKGTLIKAHPLTGVNGYYLAETQAA